MKNFLRRIGLVIFEIITKVSGAIKFIITFAKDRPAQFLAPLGVFICSIVMLTTDEPVLDPILSGIQAILLFIQFYGIIKSAKESSQKRIKEDKERLQQFFELASLGAAPSLIRFLSIYKSRWPRAWYYHLRGITRLSLFKYGEIDEIGSYTKFKVNAKDLFHLQLKGCIDTEDPDKAVEGIDHIAKEYLTK